MEDWQAGKTLCECNAYMLKNGVASDVTLVVGASLTEIAAHKHVLVSRSCVFYTMFYGSLAETGTRIIIPDIEEDVMLPFLRYLYTDDIELTPGSVMGLMYAGKKYCVPALVEQCCTYLETNMNTSNVCTILEQTHMFDELRDKCLDEIFSSGDAILNEQNDDLQNLCADCLKAVIGSDKLIVKEENIYKACLQWSGEKCKQQCLEDTDLNKRLILGDILFLIRFPAMSPQFFTQHVSTRNILTSEEKVTVFQTFDSCPRQKTGIGPRKFEFSAVPRATAQTLTVCRFEKIVGGIFDFWLNDNIVDAVSFCASKEIELVGVSVFAPFKDGLLRGRVRLYDETNWLLAKRERLEIINTTDRETKEVKFKHPVRILPDKWYTVTQEMLGAKSFHGRCGQKFVAGQGVTFTFRRSPMDVNNTDVESGQIYALLYRLSASQ